MNGARNFEKDLVSVVVPVFNRKAFVIPFLNSLVKQTYDKSEILLIDDGSTDGTYDILSDYAKSFSNIFLYRQEKNKGAQSCRNIGLELARGEYIIFFDSDDYVQPFCLEQRVAYLRKNPALDFAVFPVQEFFQKVGDRERYWGLPVKEDVLSMFLMCYIPISGWTNIYRTESLLRHNLLWDEKLKSKQDVDFNIQCLLAGLHFEYARNVDIDYYFRVISNKGSVSKNSRSRKHFDSHAYLCYKVFSLVQKRYGDIYNKQLLQFIIYYILMADIRDRNYVEYLLGIIKKIKTCDIYMCMLRLYLFVLFVLKIPRNISKYILLPYYLKRRVYLNWYHSKRL